MPARFVLLAVSLAMAASASADPLSGGWKSDRDITLLETEKIAMLTLERRDVLRTHDLFGQAVMIYGDRETDLRLSGGSTRLWQQSIAAGSDVVEVEYDDAPVSLGP